MGYRSANSVGEPDSERLSNGISDTAVRVDEKKKTAADKSKKQDKIKGKFKTPHRVLRGYKLPGWVVRVLAALAVLIAIAVIIAEPWVAPLVSDEAPSGYEMLDDVEIGVGETLSFGGEHFGEETAQVVYISVPEVLEDDENGSVTALGEYYGVRVRVHIKRKGEIGRAHV